MRENRLSGLKRRGLDGPVLYSTLVVPVTLRYPILRSYRGVWFACRGLNCVDNGKNEFESFGQVVRVSQSGVPRMTSVSQHFTIGFVGFLFCRRPSPIPPLCAFSSWTWRPSLPKRMYRSLYELVRSRSMYTKVSTQPCYAKS